MSISEDKRHFVRAVACSAAFTAFVVVFGIVYDHYGRGVHSRYMSFAFLFPLVLCVIPYSLLGLFRDPARSRFAFNVNNSGAAVLTVASIIRGVVRIAGTGSRFETPMLIAGAALCAMAAIVYIIAVIKKSQRKS